MSIEPTAGEGVNRGARTLVDDVHERLVELLLEDHLEPGSPLRIDRLAARWGVSQTPVREALARAAASGLVVRLPLRGYQVAPLLSPEQFTQLMDVRLLLEPAGAALACEHATPTLLRTLDELHERMEVAPRGPTARDVRAYLHADMAFHEAIARASGNTFLDGALAATSAHAHRFRRFPGGVVTDADEAIAEHGAVLAALHAGLPAAAATAMTAHLTGVRSRALPVA